MNNNTAGTIIIAIVVILIVLSGGAIVYSIMHNSENNNNAESITPEPIGGDNPFITDVVTFEGNEYCYAQKGSNPESHVVDYYHKHHLSTIHCLKVDDAINYIDEHNGVVVSMTGYKEEFKYSYEDGSRILIAWNEY